MRDASLRKKFLNQAFDRELFRKDGTNPTEDDDPDICDKYTPLRWIFRFAKHPMRLLKAIGAFEKGLSYFLLKSYSLRTDCEKRWPARTLGESLLDLLSFNTTTTSEKKEVTAAFKTIPVFNTTPEMTPGYNVMELILNVLINKANFNNEKKFYYLQKLIPMIIPGLTKPAYLSEIESAKLLDMIDILKGPIDEEGNHAEYFLRTHDRQDGDVIKLAYFINSSFVELAPAPAVGGYRMMRSRKMSRRGGKTNKRSKTSKTSKTSRKSRRHTTRRLR
jgi:hypothetical protein